MLKQRRLPFESCQFQLLLQLIDMFLREGDIIAARRALEECKQVQQIFGNSLENVFSYYQVIEKEAVLLIDEFRYEEADTLMGKACESYENIMNTIIIDSNLKERFPNIKSEYFGDALCMKIYAEMFLQRKEPHRYEQLCKESDLAIQQYPDSEGELERHRQYRSHIELEAGNYESALQWLMMAKMYTKLSVDPLDISNFLRAVDTTEYIISCQYYLMYYLLIMAEASKARDSLADVMYNALCGQSEFLKKSGIMLKNSVKDKTDSDFMEINIKNAVQKSSGINYHPMEIIHWKLASYYFYNKKYDEAIIYYKSAYKICCKCSNYDTMKITGLGILAEMICCMVEAKMEDTAVQKYKLLLNETKILLEKNFPENTKALLREMKKLEEGALKNDKVDSKSMYELSRIITY